MRLLQLFIFILLMSTSYGKTITVDNLTRFQDILNQSEVYIDTTKAFSFDDILRYNHDFETNEKLLLAYGYSPNFNVWVRFTLKNDTKQKIKKVLEYDNALTTHIEFYAPKENVKKDGLLSINPHRKTISPTFEITLNPGEEKTYYIKASSNITTLIIKLNLWDAQYFYSEEVKHQFILALFFGAMLILGLYNLFIYFFTRDISYFYYVLYIMGVIIHHSLYVGVAHIYLLKPEWIIYTLEMVAAIVALPIFAMGLFTRSFLNTVQYPKIDKVLIALLIIVPISVLFFLFSNQFQQYRYLFLLILLVYLVFVTIYGAFKKNRQAYFVLFGWVIIAIAIICMMLSSLGVFNIYESFPYIVEAAIAAEMVIFSIALADRINSLQKEKNIVTQKLLDQQQNETNRLEIKVNEKTKDLKVALGEKELLLKELNHRVKNNMQTIVSLIRLQSDNFEEERMLDVFITIQNRINAIGQIHELLYKQDNLSHIDAYEYFDLLIDELNNSYENNININFDIQTQLSIEDSIYCGLILNELVSNAYKYAYEDRQGDITISLTREKGFYKLCVSDKGKGFPKDQDHSNSLGLSLVETLSKKQLKGEFEISSENGVEVTVKWSNHD